MIGPVLLLAGVAAISTLAWAADLARAAGRRLRGPARSDVGPYGEPASPAAGDRNTWDPAEGVQA